MQRGAVAYAPLSTPSRRDGGADDGGDDDPAANLHSRFSPAGCTREEAAAALRDSGGHAGRAAKRLRDRYPGTSGRRSGREDDDEGDDSPSRWPDTGLSQLLRGGLLGGQQQEPEPEPELVRIFSQSAGGHVSATVVERLAGVLTVRYAVGGTERTKQIREDAVGDHGRPQVGDKKQDDEELSVDEDEDAEAHGGEEDRSSEDDDDQRGFADAMDVPSYSQPAATRPGSPIVRQRAASEGQQLRLRLDAEASVGLTTAAIGALSLSALFGSEHASLDSSGLSAYESPALEQWLFVIAMVLTAALSLFAVTLSGGIYSEGLKILSADQTALFHQWWLTPGVRRGRAAARWAQSACVLCFLVGVASLLHASYGDPRATVAACALLGSAWLAASAMRAQIEGYSE